MSNTYDLFQGSDLEVAQLIQRRRLQLVVHSYLYYVMNENIVSDSQWSKWAQELVKLQADHPNIARQVIYWKEFEGFDGSTGFDLTYIKDDAIKIRAEQLLAQKGKVDGLARKTKSRSNRKCP